MLLHLIIAVIIAVLFVAGIRLLGPKLGFDADVVKFIVMCIGAVFLIYVLALFWPFITNPGAELHWR